MEANNLAKFRCVAAIVLAATAICRPLRAAEAAPGATATPASTLVLTTHDAESPQPSRSNGSDLIVRAASVETPAMQSPAAEPRVAAQGNLTVVANPQGKSPAAAIVSSTAAKPVAEMRRIPAPAAAQVVEAAPAISEANAADALLIQAHRLSLSASTEADYAQVVRQCAEAMRHEPVGENRTFALQLSAWALNRRGQVRSDQGQGDLGMADFNAALELDPNQWRALHNRGVSYAQAGQFAEAFDDVSRVIQLNPAFAKAFSNRATLYVQAGDMNRALADYQEALRLDPALVPALVGHGRVSHLAGRREEALASFNAAIKLASHDADVFCSRGDLLADLGRYSEALADYSAAIELNPQFEHAYRNGAWLLATCPSSEVRDPEGALVGAQKALDCGYGERHAALDTLAAAQANAGRFDEAVRTISQAIEVAPAEAKNAYLARKQLYESRQPFRTQPVSEAPATELAEESWQDVSGGNEPAAAGAGVQRSGFTEVF